MRRPTLKTATLCAAALLLTFASACGKKDMDARRGPDVVQSPDRFDAPTRVPGFSDYDLTPVSPEQLQDMYSILRTDLTVDPWNMCSERAHIWAYQQWKTRGVDTGKVFLFYTTTGPRMKGYSGNPANRKWLWHAAPYVATTNGDLVVLEKFNTVDAPMGLRDWLRYQSNFSEHGQECVELNGTEKEIMKYTCGPLTADGECTRGAPNYIRVEEGGPKCYFRRVPPFYVYPRDVANHDYLERPAFTQWEERHVYSVCNMVMTNRDGARRAKCLEVLADSANDLDLGLLNSTASSFVQPQYGRSEFAGEVDSGK